MLLYYVDFFLKQALLHANQVLGAYKMGNEETFTGYATSLTVALFTADNKAHIAHVGNTRFYILRNSKIIQLTKDQTKAQELLDAGEIDEQTYYVHPYRLNITDGLGISTLPNISNICVSITDTDLFLMTTDGIHYAIRPENMKELVLSGQDVVPACNNLIDAAKNIIKYPDNMSAIVIGIILGALAETNLGVFFSSVSFCTAFINFDTIFLHDATSRLFNLIVVPPIWIFIY